jgi:hypothetical protein
LARLIAACSLLSIVHVASRAWRIRMSAAALHRRPSWASQRSGKTPRSALSSIADRPISSPAEFIATSQRDAPSMGLLIHERGPAGNAKSLLGEDAPPRSRTAWVAKPCCCHYLQA